ncbi:hydroxymethylpyrimidine/phosphomethylpyrimidine kinase [bacterium]|nr:hydroxymethylpyrimidine/phosphomethylpyrimidine kinase [bacterium]
MKPVCLTIAGSDSGRGAGIQADLKTFASLGCYGTTVITALTAQNTCGIKAVQAIDPDFVSAQLEAVMKDMPVSAVKIGILPNQSVVSVVARFLAKHSKPVVLDPVLVSTSGTSLMETAALETLKQHLFPLCKLVTPNFKEVELLSGSLMESESTTETIGREMMVFGQQALLITGGDRPGVTK